ncbi:sugar kinase [Vibrio sp. SS-MA-C1-2]|uniref:sugar kinase n=1 Tax=Vibrio sp. SS-MA-C1-2 TaxID=2908646 RepID=UPI001F388563|nr:sugar kinase [Vibrio sp. SS-MA-C1-2]UJF17618.1 sugar kinase [Vibrio sp. SS-MA-C1-2]
MKNIAIIGECMIELNGKPFGNMHQTFGGDTLNAAIYLSRSLPDKSENIETPVRISYVSALGSDPLSQGMLAHWQQEGIDTRFVLEDKVRTPGLYLIQLDDEGERTFLYWRNQSPARYLLQHPEFESHAEQLKTMDMVFLSGISLAILPDEDRQKLLTLLVQLRENGVEIGFDSNFRASLWPQNDNDQTVKDCYQLMYQTTDLALVTFDDEQQLWGDNTPQETLVRLQKAGVKKAVIKLGAEGCLTQDFSTQDAPISVATTPVQNVVDTTSAGDSFNGGFLAHYLQGAVISDASQRGNALAGIVIQHKGAIISKSATDTVTKL